MNKEMRKENLAEKSIRELFPEKKEKRRIKLKYSNRFSEYNANVKYNNEEIIFSLSKKWDEVSPEIQQGLIEHLLCKMYGEKKKSIKQDLYRSFMKNLSEYSRVKEQEEYLKKRFEIINNKYFFGLMSEANIKWGREATTKLGHYEYATDTIVISSIFKEAKIKKEVEELLDFVIYHEMLHKKHKYNHKKERSRHHTRAFREDEKKWHDKNIEKKLRNFVRKKKIKKILRLD